MANLDEITKKIHDQWMKLPKPKQTITSKTDEDTARKHIFYNELYDFVTSEGNRRTYKINDDTKFYLRDFDNGKLIITPKVGNTKGKNIVLTYNNLQPEDDNSIFNMFKRIANVHEENVKEHEQITKTKSEQSLPQYIQKEEPASTSYGHRISDVKSEITPISQRTYVHPLKRHYSYDDSSNMTKDELDLGRDFNKKFGNQHVLFEESIKDNYIVPYEHDPEEVINILSRLKADKNNAIRIDDFTLFPIKLTASLLNSNLDPMQKIELIDESGKISKYQSINDIIDESIKEYGKFPDTFEDKQKISDIIYDKYKKNETDVKNNVRNIMKKILDKTKGIKLTRRRDLIDRLQKIDF